MTKKKISLCYKFLVVFSLATGIALNLYRTTSVAALVSYYTLQSNIISLIAFISFTILEIRKKEKNNIYYLLKGEIVIAILITAIIYHIALAPGGFEMDSLQKSISNKQIANLFVHTISPLLVIGDYIFFDEKGNFKNYYPFVWLMIPLNYLVYVYTYSLLGGKFFSIGGSKKFAYFFLDYTKIGAIGVFCWIMLMCLVIIVISYALVFVDNRLGRKKEL